jgi:hypothetical protein
VGSKINGGLNAWDLAWQCGLSLADTFKAVGALAQSGLCAPCPVIEWPDDDWALPHRRPDGPEAPAAAAPRDPAGRGVRTDEATAASPPLDSLRRVLDGLRRL